MNSLEKHCVGCSDSLPTGSYRRLLKTVWEEMVKVLLKERRVTYSGNTLSGEYVCRKCLRAYESFDASKKRIILGLTKAIDFFLGYDAGETSTSPKAVTQSLETVSPFSPAAIVQATKVSSL